MVEYLKVRCIACLAVAVAAAAGTGCSSGRGCRGGGPANAPAPPVPVAAAPASPGVAVAPQPGPASLPPAPAAARYGGQKTCPVMGDVLGEMGEPIPVAVKGQTVYVCCRGCVAKVRRDPDKYLAVVAAERAGR
ncbi:MAG: hypothetical protein K2X82_12550 [Gemmataceae bacterium]|nr:hypothetical protein [Gemmataceae bacterium]